MNRKYDGPSSNFASNCNRNLRPSAEVTVLARTPSKMAYPPGSGGAQEGQPFSDPNLTMVQGDVNNAADVAKVITAATTGVVVSLGGKSKDVGKTMLTDGRALHYSTFPLNERRSEDMLSQKPRSSCHKTCLS